MSPLPIFRTVAALRTQIAAWRREGHEIGLVPTMGALHEGHLSLVKAGLERVRRVVATVFVNPTQFGPGEDLAAYPRQEAKDAAMLAGAGAHGLFAPSVAEMYPDGFATTVRVAGLSEGLCGAFRPGHFDGVATVVAKLLNQAGPDLALFGEKDYQQLQVIRRMVRDLDLPVEVVGVPTLREADGLAMSSRNAYLGAAERAIAPAIFRTAKAMAAALKNGAAVAGQIAWGYKELLAAGFDSVDYVAVCDSLTLAPLEILDKPARILIAARLGKARLIDNIPIG